MTATQPLEVLIIGAGFAGIGAAIKLLEKGVTNLRVFDKAGGVGGTWWHNRYPGAACDVPSHFYCYSFEPNPDWSRLHAPQPEIQAYIERCAEKYGVMPHVELGKAITGLSWDVKRSLWFAAFADGDTAEARFVINGMGALHQPKIPQFRGADTFAGETMHTACWNPDSDPAGKRIAVIGSAASAIQAVPELAKTAAMVHLFQRTPNYIAPRNDYAYSDEQRAQFRSDPDAMRAERERIFNEAETRLWPLIVDQASRDRTRELLKLYLGTQVRNRKYRAALTPGFDVGCKRLLFSDDFLASLNEDNVELVTEPISAFTGGGIVTADGAERPLDAIIYATGFDIESHQRSIDIRGENGLSLSDAWKDGARAYMSVLLPDFPNYFMATGPNSGVATTSVVFMIEQALDWIIRCIDRAGDNGVVTVTPEATARYNREVDERLARTVWVTGGCKSWYHSAEGRVETLFPGNANDYRSQMSKIEPDDVRIAAPAIAEMAGAGR
ncbi:flavin-containing monooxygenase [Oricola sp.]|uniref:flavin-containing monooxygenase n=1 Tax=Oricola sp. TaxID=1979950 RepID=UPI003511589D